MKTALLEREPPSKEKSTTLAKPSRIKWFCEIEIDDVPLVGGKTAALGEMFRKLAPKVLNQVASAGTWRTLNRAE